MTASWWSGRFALVFICAACLIAPLWCVHSPAMPDFPAHLASYYLIANGAHAPEVAKFYQIHWAFLPNLAGEILVPTFGIYLGIEVATKIFISIAVALWVIGPALIHRALFGTFGFTAPLSAFFAYNANFMWGFLNYYFAAGLAFVAFAAWIATDGNRSYIRLGGLAAAVTLIYFSHLFAVAALLLMILCFEAGCLYRNRASGSADRLVSALQIAAVFAPAAISYLILKPAGGKSGVEFNFADSWPDRIEAAIQHSYDRPFYALIAVLIAFAVVGVWRRILVMDRRMIPVLLGVALVTLLSPEWAMGGWGVDLRLPAVLGSLIFASAELHLSRHATALLAGSAVALIGYNAFVLTASWKATDHQFQEFRRAVHRLPAGSKILTVLDGDAIGLQSDQPYWHMAEFAIIDPGAFTPLLFTTKDQHIVRLRSQYQPIAAASAQQGSPPDISELNDLSAGLVDGDADIQNVFPYLVHFQCHFDEAVVIDLDGPRSEVPGMLKLRIAGSFFAIYDVLPDAACSRK